MHILMSFAEFYIHVHIHTQNVYKQSQSLERTLLFHPIRFVCSVHTPQQPSALHVLTGLPLHRAQWPLSKQDSNGIITVTRTMTSEQLSLSFCRRDGESIFRHCCFVLLQTTIPASVAAICDIVSMGGVSAHCNLTHYMLWEGGLGTDGRNGSMARCGKKKEPEGFTVARCVMSLASNTCPPKSEVHVA